MTNEELNTALYKKVSQNRRSIGSGCFPSRPMKS